MDYWGEKDTSISFCENKYTDVFWIAEYYNTVSSFMYILVALPFLKGKISKVAWSSVGVGIGSMMLHGTMRFYGQWIDEISMLLFSYYSLKKIDPQFPDLLPVFISVYLVQWHHFLVFISIFLSMQLRIFFILSKQKKLGSYFYSLFFFIASIFWIFDQCACSYVITYQFHAFWHFFTSLSMFTSMLIL